MKGGRGRRRWRRGCEGEGQGGWGAGREGAEGGQGEGEVFRFLALHRLKFTSGDRDGRGTPRAREGETQSRAWERERQAGLRLEATPATFVLRITCILLISVFSCAVTHWHLWTFMERCVRGSEVSEFSLWAVPSRSVMAVTCGDDSERCVGMLYYQCIVSVLIYLTNFSVYLCVCVQVCIVFVISN